MSALRSHGRVMAALYVLAGVILVQIGFNAWTTWTSPLATCRPVD